ncbi:MAG: Rpn family recombination-promoting nuclease/putative transposase [Bacteroidales bacterium]|jgi:predicted transposase/invertase (TIGR01784 family)|nr:Rpn family recombination-promoting nuclease/putative transposase [Bacteroidales bacterium]
MKRDRPLVSFDWAVKRLLRDKANFDVVEGFLSVLLGCRIRITSVLESEGNRVSSTDKFNRVDVVVEDEAGEIILIELQFMEEIDYFQRMLFGTSQAIVERMVGGDTYMKIRKIYSINIVYFDLGRGVDYVYHGKTDFRGLHDSDILELSPTQQEIFGKIEAGDLYPEYYVLKVKNFDDVAKTKLDEWIYFFKNDRIEAGFNAPGLPKAREILDYSRLSPAEKAEYDFMRNESSHKRSQIFTAKLRGEEEAEKKYAKALEEKDKTLEEKDREIAELKRLLNMK